MARPSKLNQIVQRRDDGKPVTAAELVIERVRATWAPWEDAAASAGIARATLSNWRRDGARARAKAAQGLKLTRREKDLASFVDALEKAEAEAKLGTLGGIVREARGGYPIVKVVERLDASGALVERTTTTETARPVWQANAWLLERRDSANFGRTMKVEGVKDGEPIPVDLRASQLAESLRAFQAGADAQRELDAVPGALANGSKNGNGSGETRGDMQQELAPDE